MYIINIYIYIYIYLVSLTNILVCKFTCTSEYKKPTMYIVHNYAYPLVKDGLSICLSQRCSIFGGSTKFVIGIEFLFVCFINSLFTLLPTHQCPSPDISESSINSRTSG